MTLTVPQIYNVARKAGFTRTQAVVATAIALAESIGGDPAAHNPGTAAVPEDSWGLWQINILAHPQFSDWNLTDPLTNARAAYAVSNGGKNFAPWSTYGTAEQYGAGHTNSYAAKLPEVYKGLGLGRGDLPPDSVPGVDVPSSPGGSSSSGGTSAGGVSWWHNLNPFGWFGSIGSGIGQDVAKVTLTTAFAVAGMGLVVVGLVKGVSPNMQKVLNVPPTTEGGGAPSGGAATAGAGAASAGASGAGGAANLAKVAAL